jgi:fibronectin-binding autotransporter adhesin
MKPNRKNPILLASLSLALSPCTAVAADLYWDGASASWNNIANWSTASGATTPNPLAVPGASDNAIFNITSVNGAQSITMDANQSATGVTFNNTDTTTLLGGGTARTLNLGSGGITIGASAGAVTFGDGTAGNNVLFNLTRAQTWTNNSAAAFTLNNTTFSARTAGSTLNFAGTGTFAASAIGFPNDGTGFSGPWAFIGTGTETRYAFNNAGTIAGYTGATVIATLGSATSATTNFQNTQTGNAGITANRNANTIRHVGNGSSTVNYRFDASDRSMTLNGLLNVSGNTLTISANTGITGSQVVIGSSNELILAGSHQITISVPVTGLNKSLSVNTNTILNGINTYSGGTYINSNFLQLGNTAAAGSGPISLGNGSANAELKLLGTGTTIANALTVHAGAGTKTLSAASNTVTYSGNITANDNLLISGTAPSRLQILTGVNAIAAGKTVAFSTSSTTVSNMMNGASWSGDGSISYTASNAQGITVSGDNTYSGGTTLGVMSNTGVVEVGTSSTGPANAPTSGAFGTGTLSIGATKMRAGTTADITIGNAVAFTENSAFTTIASEKSLIFSGNASLGATRTLTVETGSTVAGKVVEFSGEISGSEFGIDKQGAGTLVLSGTNSYTGATDLTTGTLVVRGNITTSVLLTVASGATLGGDGTVGAAGISGILAPGNSIGTLTATGDVTWNANNAWVFELGTASADLAAASLGSDNDLLNVTGAGNDFLKGSGTSFAFDFANTGAVGFYKLVDWADITNFVEGDFLATNLATGLSGTFTVDSETSALYLNVIPEPSAALLGGLGLLALLRRRRK